MCLVSGFFFFVLTKKIKNWILEILPCWNRRFHKHGRIPSTRLCLKLRLSECGRSLFGLLFLLLLLRLLGSNVLRTFFVVLWRKRPRRRVKSRMHDEVEENGEPVAGGACCSSMADAKRRQLEQYSQQGERREVCDYFSASEKVAGRSKSIELIKDLACYARQPPQASVSWMALWLILSAIVGIMARTGKSAES